VADEQGAGLAGLPTSVIETSSIDLDQVRKLHQLRSLRLQSALRVGVVGLMVGAMLVGTSPNEWKRQSVLLILYGLAALWAAILAFSPWGASIIWRVPLSVFALVDVAAILTYEFLSEGGYVPLLVMALLPLMVALEVSSRRAAVVLASAFISFGAYLLADPAIERFGWIEAAFIVVMYGFLCSAAFLVVYVQGRHVDEITRLSASREELLAQTMTASETERRRVSESIHDGPLQHVLVARQEILELARTSPGEELDRAAASLHDASRQLREATFELHPAVLEHVGLGAAVEQLALFNASRSGIPITTDIDYPTKNAVDAIMFGVVRELLSNVVRHSQASKASVKLTSAQQTCRLEVTDNGIGMSTEVAARRLAQGHIGLASHRARVEAAGGMLTILNEPVGTHVRVELPLRR
jgi:two-component system, NarL family, sensor kinase